MAEKYFVQMRNGTEYESLRSNAMKSGRDQKLKRNFAAKKAVNFRLLVFEILKDVANCPRRISGRWIFYHLSANGFNDSTIYDPL